MADAVIASGDKLHIMERRLFEDDKRRHSVGEVRAVDGAVCEVRGYTFVFNATLNEFRRRPESRARIFSLTDAGNIINKLPPHVEIENLRYRIEEKRLVVTDSRGFSLDINEFAF